MKVPKRIFRILFICLLFISFNACSFKNDDFENLFNCEFSNLNFDSKCTEMINKGTPDAKNCMSKFQMSETEAEYYLKNKDMYSVYSMNCLVTNNSNQPIQIREFFFTNRHKNVFFLKDDVILTFYSINSEDHCNFTASFLVKNDLPIGEIQQIIKDMDISWSFCIKDNYNNVNRKDVILNFGGVTETVD